MSSTQLFEDEWRNPSHNTPHHIVHRTCRILVASVHTASYLSKTTPHCADSHLIRQACRPEVCADVADTILAVGLHQKITLPLSTNKSPFTYNTRLHYYHNACSSERVLSVQYHFSHSRCKTSMRPLASRDHLYIKTTGSCPNNARPLPY